MICNKCGRQCADGERYCPQCGNTLTPDAGGNAVAQAFIAAFKDPLFMVMCILTTVSIFSGNLMNVLFAIFMWIVFAKAKSNVCDISSMRCVSGTVFALTVIVWVAVGSLAVSGVACLAAGDSIAQILAYAEEISGLGTVAAGILGLTGAILFVVMLICAAILTLFNIFVFMPSHKLAKSMYQSAQNGVMTLTRAKYTANAMLVIGILDVISVLSGAGNGKIADLLFGLCGAAVWIIAFVWLRKHFLSIADGADNYRF